MIKFIWFNIILGIVLNWLIAPVAYLFRKSAQKHKGFLWWFLSDENMYGDKDWRPNLKNKHLRAIVWMYRNPLQNKYWQGYVDGKESDFKGTLKYKFRADPLMWRTMITETGNWHGKILDFEHSLFGVQNITFTRTDTNGNVQNCYRKSTCIPYRVFGWIILIKRRSGHENGLMQYNFTFPTFKYKLCKEGWNKWKNEPWKTMEI
jgi:hypothetical protein